MHRSLHRAGQRAHGFAECVFLGTPKRLPFESQPPDEGGRARAAGVFREASQDGAWSRNDAALAGARARQPRCREESDRQRGKTIDGELCQDLADRAGELEAVAGACRRVRHRSVAIDDEVAIRAVGVEADLGAAALAIRERHAAPQPRAYALLVSRAGLSVDGVRIDAVAEMEAGHLESVPWVVRESVVETVGVFDDVYGQPRERLELTQWLEPEEHVALDPQVRRELREQPRQPRARCDHEMLRAVVALRRRDTHAVAVALPALDRLGEAQRRAVPFRETEVCFDAALWRQPARLRIEHADPVALDVEHRIAPLELRVVEEGVLEAVRPRAQRSNASTLSPRFASLYAAALPCAPSPATIASHFTALLIAVFRLIM